AQKECAFVVAWLQVFRIDLNAEVQILRTAWLHLKVVARLNFDAFMSSEFDRVALALIGQVMDREFLALNFFTAVFLKDSERVAARSGECLRVDGIETADAACAL